jgi:multicomponent Na+:H+ antiporter subunit D
MALPALVVLVPMLAATLLAAWAPFAPPRRGLLALGPAVACVVLAAIVLHRSEHRQVVWFGGWHPRGGAAIGIDFAIDQVGAGFAVFIAALAVVAFVLAARLITEKSLAFDALALLFLAGMLGFCLSGDLFNMFVFFELMSVAGYVLVGYQVRERAPLEGSLTFAVTNTIGSILLLFGIGILYGRTGALNLAQIGRTLEAGPVDLPVVVGFALLATGLLVKAAIVPFHLWTADAYTVAPAPLLILLAGAFSEIGLYGLMRIYWTAFHGVLASDEAALRAVLVGAGVLTAVLGAVMCGLQQHLKRLLAFATIAQVGLFLMALGLLTADGVAGAAVWIVGDGLVKAALFAAVAIVEVRHGHVAVRRLHGAGRSSRLLAFVFVVAALAIASLPPTGSFLGRSLVEDAALQVHGYGWVPAFMAAVCAVVAGTLLRAAGRIFAGWGPPARDDPHAGAGDDDDPGPEADRGGEPLLAGAAALLVALAVAWGLVPGLADAAARAAASFVDTPGYAAQVLDGVARTAPATEVRQPGETAFLYALSSLAGAVLVAAAGLAGAGRRATDRTQRAARTLRALHDGRPTDYVAWTAAGAGALCAIFALALR